MPIPLRRLIYLSLAVSMLFGASRLNAQSVGSIGGTISDSTGAAIPYATVTVSNTQTGQQRTTQTSSSGVFVFPDLPIGIYTLQVSKVGFQTQKREGTELLTGQTIGLDISLTVGSQTESVTVQADTQQIQTTTSTVAQSVDEKQMQDLPLNGRNPLQLTTLTPGAVLTNTGTESGQQDNRGLTVNGLRATQNNYQLDGALYVDRFFDSVPILPSPDALQEFTIQAANFSAAYAGAGALVQLSSRSGTNHIHGSAFEFIRNTVLDSYNYFPVKNTLGQAILPPFKLNQFGGTIGGPILRDKTFFFFSAEDLQQRSAPNTITFTLPTAAEIGGNFSALCTSATYNPVTGICTKGVQIFNPTTGKPYAGNMINTAENPLSQAVYNQYLANITPTTIGATSNKYSGFSNSNIDSTQYLFRIDHAITEKNHFSARYFYVEDNFQRPFTAPTGFYAENLFRNQSLNLSDTHIFSPTLTATVYVTGGRYARTQIPIAPGLKTLQSLGMNAPLGTTNVPIFPGVRDNISGYVNIFSGGALTQDSTTFEYKGEVVKLLGAHTLTLGGLWERTRIDATDYSYVPGDNTINGARTQAPAGTTLPAGVTSGNAYADFFVGYESTFFQDNGRKMYLRENRPSLFIQDDWRVTRDLTINAGVRWDPWLPPIDKNSTLVGFVPGFKSTIAPGAPVGLQFNGDPGSSLSVFKNKWFDFAPRFGFAYNVHGAGKTVVRGAFGLFYGFPEGLLYQRTDAAQPINLYLQLNNPPQWDSPYTGFSGGDPFPRAPVPTSQFSTYTFVLPFSGGVLNPASKVSYTEDYNLTVEQQLPWQLALSIAYVGNHALHVMSSRQFNPAVYAPGATVANENARRLYPGLGAVEFADDYEYANYNSLQINVTRRVAHNLTVLTNVVYSKALDNSSSGTEGQAGPPNPYNMASGYGPADFDQKIRFNASLNYIFPKFEVRKALGVLANGWQANAIIFYKTGMPFTVASGTDRSLSGIGNDYADYVPGVSSARPAGASRLAEWFNPAAFAQAATGTFGDTSRDMLRGPGYADVDASIFKDLFTERRIHGQFRAEAFNVFNHTNFNNPGATVSSTATFGVINSAQDPRVFQFGAKVLF